MAYGYWKHIRSGYKLNYDHPSCHQLVLGVIGNSNTTGLMDLSPLNQKVSGRSGTTTLSGGAYGQALDFGTSNNNDIQFNRSGINKFADTGQPITIYAIAYPTQVSAKNMIWNMGEFSDSNVHLELSFDASAKASWGNDNATFITWGTISANTWYRVGVAQKANNSRNLIINGVITSNAGNILANTIGTGQPHVIGRGWSNAAPESPSSGFQGKIALVYVWSRQLSNSELLNIDQDPFALVSTPKPRHIFKVSGTQYTSALSCTSSAVPLRVFNIGWIRSITSTDSPTIIRQTGHVLPSIISTDSTTGVRQIGHILPTITSTDNTSRIMQTSPIKSITSACTPTLPNRAITWARSIVSNHSTSIQNVISITRSIVSSLVPSFIKSISRTLFIVSTNTSTIVSNITRVNLLTVVSTNSTSLIRQVGKVLTTASTNSTSLIRGIGKVVSATCSNAVTYIRAVFKTVSITSVNTTTTSNNISSTKIITSVSVPILVRLTNKIFSTIVSTCTAALIRLTNKILSCTSTSTASFTEVHGGNSNPITLSTTCSHLTSLIRSIGLIKVITSVYSTSVKNGISVTRGIISNATTFTIRLISRVLTTITSTNTTTVIYPKTKVNLLTITSIGITTLIKQCSKILSKQSTSIVSIKNNIGKMLPIVSNLVPVFNKALTRLLTIVSMSVLDLTTILIKSGATIIHIFSKFFNDKFNNKRSGGVG